MYCDLCCDQHHEDKLVSVHCGSYICHDCILSEAKKITKKQVVYPKRVGKPWGHEEIVEQNEHYVVKKLFINAGHRLSLQYHERKHETLILHKGKVWLKYTSVHPKEAAKRLNAIMMHPGFVEVIVPGTTHQIEAREDSIIIECSTTELDDVVNFPSLFRAYSHHPGKTHLHHEIAQKALEVVLLGLS